MCWLQFQTRAREGAEEPTTYFPPTQFDVQKKYFVIRVIVISFTFNEAL